MSKSRSKEESAVYTVDEGLQKTLAGAKAKFDESIDTAFVLGVDVKQSDQQVRGAAVLPYGLGKEIRVAVFAKGEHEAAADKAGASIVGAEDLADKIKAGWLEFDRVIATPDMMPVVAKAAKILGPKGLMPSPKTGSVTTKVFEAVQLEKKGRASFRADKNGIAHASIGKKSLGFEKLKKNYLTLAGEIVKNKPPKSKGVYVRKIHISSTMGKGFEVSVRETLDQAL